GRRLSAATEGWERDRPDPAGWELQPLPADALGRPGLAVRKEGAAVGRVRLATNQQATAQALLPPERSPSRVPLLAVAFVESGVTSLALYDVRSGRPFREYSGHVNPIRALAFSGDGRLLASAAEDQTVC